MSAPKKPDASGCLLFLLSLPLAVFGSGFSTMYLWQWFVTPLGLQPLTWVHAYALVITVGAITGGTSRGLYIGAILRKLKEQNGEQTSLSKLALSVIAAPWAPLLIGYILHFWM